MPGISAEWTDILRSSPTPVPGLAETGSEAHLPAKSALIVGPGTGPGSLLSRQHGLGQLVRGLAPLNDLRPHGSVPG